MPAKGNALRKAFRLMLNGVFSFVFSQIFPMFAFITLSQYICFKSSNMEFHFGLKKEREWPPIKIYYYNLPSKFNEDLVKATTPEFFSPYNQMFQFILELNFSQMMRQIPILTDSIDEADFVYVDFLPYYMVMCEMKFKEKFLLSQAFYTYLKENKLVDKRLFMISTRPFHELYEPVLVGYKGCLEKISNTGRWFIVPYLTYFPEFPSYNVDFSKERNVSVFLTGSVMPRRRWLFDVVSKINNSQVIRLNRRDGKQISYLLYNLPLYYMNSRYVVVPVGDSSSSKRFYDAVIYGAIPIVVSDTFELPFDKTQVNWDNCVIKIKQKDVDQLPDIINNISEYEYQRMYSYIQKARDYIIFDNGVRSSNGVGSILWELYYTHLQNKDKEITNHKSDIEYAENYMKLPPDQKQLGQLMRDKINKDDPTELSRHNIWFGDFHAWEWK